MPAQTTPRFTDYDQHLFNQGVHYTIYQKMGGRLVDLKGANFTIWAPNATKVCVVGDFSNWDPEGYPMEPLGNSGIWQLFIPELRAGTLYKFVLHLPDGRRLWKTDPYGLAFEKRPSTAAVLTPVDDFTWHDEGWMSQRAERASRPFPANIYEVHLGSWKRQDGDFVNYRVLGQELATYCRHMGFTHVELLPPTEHPLDESWGYQCTGYFAPTSRHGSVHDFKAFVDILHQHEIGVIIDWVPAHFPSDDWALARFDGTALYEHEDPRQGLHPHWGTCIFNFGRREVSNFLIASALFWCDVMHVDGLRVDAVASMLYLDYGREPGDWIPNQFAGKENLEAVEFLRHLNSQLHSRHPGVLVIAEESTSFGGVTAPLNRDGLGFDWKWNLGWMNDTLSYFKEDPISRSHHHRKLTFGLLYVFSEKFVNVLSHDEVVHGKRSLLSKMPGDDWQKFAGLRLLYTYMCCQPGKNLIFMTGEIGQWDEWNCTEQMQWFLLKYPIHDGLRSLVREANHIVLKHPALWERDFDSHGFEWVDFSDSASNVISYLRRAETETLLCIHHFSPVYRENYEIPFRHDGEVREIFNSDAQRFGGSGVHSNPTTVREGRLRLNLPPLSTLILRVPV